MTLTVYAILVGREPVGLFYASDERDADNKVCSRYFQKWFVSITHKGKPLWDRITRIDYRPAYRYELTLWNRVREEATREGVSADENMFVSLLTIDGIVIENLWLSYSTYAVLRAAEESERRSQDFGNRLFMAGLPAVHSSDLRCS